MRGAKSIFFFGVKQLLLSGSTVPSSAGIGTVVGNLSVLNGVGVYTYSLTSNPGGLYSIVGSSLEVAAALSVGSDPITIKADNGAGSVVIQSFNITVTGSVNGPMDFSVPGNIGITGALP